MYVCPENVLRRTLGGVLFFLYRDALPDADINGTDIINCRYHQPRISLSTDIIRYRYHWVKVSLGKDINEEEV